MSQPDATEVFEAERPGLVRLAYRMLGTPDDADDVVQDAWLRWQGATVGDIDNPAAWLTTVTTRLSIDRLTSARRRREAYVGPWLPEPLTIDSISAENRRLTPQSSTDPAILAVETESIELGLLRILETLGPAERAAFLLHDVFGYPFDQISPIIGKSAAATRQIGKRARDRVRSGRPRVDTEPADVSAWSETFLGAVVQGDVDGLIAMLASDVVHISDGGAERHAARRPVIGAERVGRLLVNLTARSLELDDDLHWIRVNGQVALYVIRGGEPNLLSVVSWSDGRVAELLTIANPAKLARFHERWLAKHEDDSSN